MKNIKIRKVEKKEAPMELLLLADPSEQAISEYLEKGDCFIAFEGENVIGTCVLVPNDESVLEIMNIAVAIDKQSMGVGKLLIQNAITHATKKGINKLVVGTGNSSLGQIAFYQKCGFRISGIKKDYFSGRYDQPIIENGIVCRDMIIFEMSLK